MQVQNPRRTLLIGIVVWLLVFGWWFRGFLFRNWQFRLFSYQSWRYLFREFRAGWHISSKSDWIFILSFLLAPFIFALLWYLAERFRWRKVWEKIWGLLTWPFLIEKKKELKEVEATYSPKQPTQTFVYRPASMPAGNSHVQNTTAPVEGQKTFLNNSTTIGEWPNVAPEASKGSFSFPGPSPYATAPAEHKVEPFTNEALAQMAEVPLADVKIPEMEPVKEDVPALLAGAGYVVLPEAIAESEKVDFVAASANEVLIALYDKEEGDWLADEESFNDEDPLWFSETDHRISPVFRLKAKADLFKHKLEGDFSVRPILIEQKGTIINAEDMMKTWNDLGVTVCRTAQGGPVELPTVTETLKEPREKISDEALEKIKGLL